MYTSNKLHLFIIILMQFTLVCSAWAASDFCESAFNEEVHWSQGKTDNTQTRETKPKPIIIHPSRVFDFDDISFSSQFAGGGAAEVRRLESDLFEVRVDAENYPINDSPWYAFKVWRIGKGDLDRVRIKLTYREGEKNFGGTHRYYPKISIDGNVWRRLDRQHYQYDKASNVAILSVPLNAKPIWISAQERITSSDIATWASKLGEMPIVESLVIGKSTGNRDIHKLEITAPNQKPKKHIIILGGQHPPEVTGMLAMMNFVNTLTSGSALSRRFLEEFSVVVIPLINPDGLDLGHWRHNLRGVDLNRDWNNFFQKETQIVRDALLQLSKDGKEVVFGLDFHSTVQDIFYILRKEIDPSPLARQWIAEIQSKFANYPLPAQPIDESKGASDGWLHRTFGISAVVYEVGDETDRSVISTVSAFAAQSLMTLLLQN